MQHWYNMLRYRMEMGAMLVIGFAAGLVVGIGLTMVAVVMFY